ncbi:3'-5' exonuclease [Dietzia sp. KRD202]|uniref:3'-5' exonuclease n=1 Tax=Dietzia sp. KRD202 TaxID=2729732 RepID=UPI0019CFB8DB|nr:3'-5' exonuclease [Dietzia sp. KRD202]
MTTTPVPVIVVDVETSGLNPEQHSVLEVAAVPLNTSDGDGMTFAPALPADWLGEASFDALSLNKYFERRLWQAELSEADTEGCLYDLAELLDGAIFAGSNPAFDVAFLRPLFEQYGVRFPQIHHRLLDLAPYAAGALGIGTDLPGLARVCELLHIPHPDAHTALGDAQVTVEAFRELSRLGQSAGISR